ncbi:MAG: hypothetical protein IPO86_00270 [Saprospiraceae bacterium]|nr:hypothetical protein [Saprospiraceae bacterium]MBK9726531.1 hypothetical protein [Saprospiraceae bacterium]
MKSKKCFVIFSIFSFSNCFITNTPGFYSGYSKLTEEQKKSIIFVEENTSFCDLKNDQRIYSISANQLLKCLKRNQTSIIYFWSPNCHAKSCISLVAAQKYCDNNNYTLYIITEYYDLEKIKIQNNVSLSMLAVNHEYYKTDYCNKYVDLFTKEIVKNKKLTKPELHNRFFVFKADSLVKTKAILFTE